MDDERWVSRHGDDGMDAYQVLRTTVGSEVHGISVEGTEDHDEMGVYVEPPELLLGTRVPAGHLTLRTQPDGARSGYGDVDLSLYSLRRYLRLVVAGNPTVLLPLFTPDDDVLHVTDEGRRLRDAGPSLLSRETGRRFLGYLRGQREKLLAARDLPNRPELVTRYGFDTKYASHALRLAVQGLQVVREGRLTLPLPDDDRRLVMAVKTGGHSLESSVALVDERADELERLVESGVGPLPEQVDPVAVDRLSAELHRAHWARVHRWP